MLSFVLLGDQNAGKSTFLHSFTYHRDAHFLELSSLVPVLSASFVNSRFLLRVSTRSERREFNMERIDMYSCSSSRS